MPGFTLRHEPATGIVACRITGPLTDADALQLGTELGEAIAEARRGSGGLRLFWDNREGIPFASEKLRTLVDEIRLSQRDGDRTAILVSSSLMKVRARQQTSEAHEIFISESAAMTWLNAWK